MGAPQAHPREPELGAAELRRSDSPICVVGLFPFYMLGVAAVIRLRRLEPALHRPFRVPLYPLVPAVFLVGAACTMAGAMNDVTSSTGIALLIVLLGIPVERLHRRWGNARD